MKAAAYLVAGTLLMCTAACSNGGGAQSNGGVPFDNGVRTDLAQPTTCSPADATCGAGVGNPAVQSPVQKREINASPQ